MTAARTSASASGAETRASIGRLAERICATAAVNGTPIAEAAIKADGSSLKRFLGDLQPLRRTT
jgi:hypothetical protein